MVLGLFLVPTLFVLYQAIATPVFTPLLDLTTTVLPGYFANTLVLSPSARITMNTAEASFLVPAPNRVSSLVYAVSCSPRK